ncbi:hypothetical protein [Rhodoplanes roseus]|uniref:Uncharacterized protein n=1 Tax=Rhodoplanes roseus TaxID=29409 RepID=A0A327KWG9_9BRAD|nr:hypothetical protein [Rhodoplanes roseus]RAI42651.1 hypothetical protein CH341_18500 [Rhodoplanes roseus]
MSEGLDEDEVFFAAELSISPCFGCRAVHLDLIDEDGAVGARAIVEVAEIDRTVAALLDCRRRIERVRDSIGACEGEA